MMPINFISSFVGGARTSLDVLAAYPAANENLRSEICNKAKEVRIKVVLNCDIYKRITSFNDWAREGINLRILPTFVTGYQDIVIVDETKAIFSCTRSVGNTKAGNISFHNGEPNVSKIKTNFENMWRHAVSPSEFGEFLYYKELSLEDETEDRKIITASNDLWSQTILELQRNPNDFYKMSPRSFEEFVAHLLEKQGFRANLTPVTRDGGKDIIVSMPHALGDLLYLVECKRYAPNRPVDVSIVRCLYGVVEQSRATAGMIVTTSHFTKDALIFREPIKHRIGLSDFDALKAWIKRYS